MENMDHYDVAIVGGGVIGCAILHELSLKGYTCILLEKNQHLLSGASCGNSGIYASGFDTEPSTMEGKCLAQAAALNETIYRKYNIPRGKAGAIVCAFSDAEIQKLPGLLAEAHRAGTSTCKLLSSREILEMEPNITPNIKGGMWVPGERALDPWLLPITLVQVAKEAGAKVLTSSEVLSGQRMSDGGWELRTQQGTIRALFVVNAGGLYGDRVEEISHKSSFRVQPRQGEYVVYDKDAGRLVNHILLPVPTERTKGVIIFPSVYGNLVVGPTADDVNHREAPFVSPHTVTMLTSYAHRVIPRLADHAILTTYAGLRPATEHKDYCIKHHPDRNWLTVGGIRSTGVSACLAIASHAHYLLERALGALPTRAPVQTVRPPTWTLNKDSTITMDGESYSITHPLTKLGLEKQSVLNSRL